MVKKKKPQVKPISFGKKIGIKTIDKANKLIDTRQLFDTQISAILTKQGSNISQGWITTLRNSRGIPPLLRHRMPSPEAFALARQLFASGMFINKQVARMVRKRGFYFNDRFAQRTREKMNVPAVGKHMLRQRVKPETVKRARELLRENPNMAEAKRVLEREHHKISHGTLNAIKSGTYFVQPTNEFLSKSLAKEKTLQALKLFKLKGLEERLDAIDLMLSHIRGLQNSLARAEGEKEKKDALLKLRKTRSLLRVFSRHIPKESLKTRGIDFSIKK